MSSEILIGSTGIPPLTIFSDSKPFLPHLVQLSASDIHNSAFSVCQGIYTLAECCIHTDLWLLPFKLCIVVFLLLKYVGGEDLSFESFVKQTSKSVFREFHFSKKEFIGNYDLNFQVLVSARFVEKVREKCCFNTKCIGLLRIIDLRSE